MIDPTKTAERQYSMLVSVAMNLLLAMIASAIVIGIVAWMTYRAVDEFERGYAAGIGISFIGFFLARACGCIIQDSRRIYAPKTNTVTNCTATTVESGFSLGPEHYSPIPAKETDK